MLSNVSCFPSLPINSLCFVFVEKHSFWFGASRSLICFYCSLLAYSSRIVVRQLVKLNVTVGSCHNIEHLLHVVHSNFRGPAARRLGRWFADLKVAWPWCKVFLLKCDFSLFPGQFFLESLTLKYFSYYLCDTPDVKILKDAIFLSVLYLLPVHKTNRKGTGATIEEGVRNCFANMNNSVQ